MPNEQAAQAKVVEQPKSRRAEFLTGEKWKRPSPYVFGGKKPFTGALVWLWYISGDITQRNEMRPLPSFLVEEDSRGNEADAKRGCWALTFFNRGLSRQKSQVPFSETPRLGYWSWPIDPNEVKEEDKK